MNKNKYDFFDLCSAFLFAAYWWVKCVLPDTSPKNVDSPFRDKFWKAMCLTFLESSLEFKD